PTRSRERCRTVAQAGHAAAGGIGVRPASGRCCGCPGICAALRGSSADHSETSRTARLRPADRRDGARRGSAALHAQSTRFRWFRRAYRDRDCLTSDRSSSASACARRWTSSRPSDPNTSRPTRRDAAFRQRIYTQVIVVYAHMELDERPVVWDASNLKHIERDHPERAISRREVNEALSDPQRVETIEVRKGVRHHASTGATATGRLLVVVWVDDDDG